MSTLAQLESTSLQVLVRAASQGTATRSTPASFNVQHNPRPALTEQQNLTIRLMVNPGNKTLACKPFSRNSWKRKAETIRAQQPVQTFATAVCQKTRRLAFQTRHPVQNNQNENDASHARQNCQRNRDLLLCQAFHDTVRHRIPVRKHIRRCLSQCIITPIVVYEQHIG